MLYPWPPSQHSFFFLINKATRLAWLGQVRGALLTIAQQCGQHGEAMRHASLPLPILACCPGEVEQSHSLGFCLTIALTLAALGLIKLFSVWGARYSRRTA